MMLILAIALGFFLDALIGDPEGVWHPVCLMGAMISKIEKFFRSLPLSKSGQRFAGVLLWIAVCSVSFLVPYIILEFLFRIHPWIHFVVNVIFCYQIFARKCLADAGRYVRKELKKSLEDGRKAVARYVGRDTSELSEEGVIKAAVETIAENTTDGVVAPFIFMLIGGAPLGFLYKAVNTLDSMIGYKNEKYRYLGWFSAKMDDIFNFLPARIAAVCMMAAAGMLKFDTVNAKRIFQRDRFNHKSPNSAQTESVCAGALHIQLGGDAKYFGEYVKKPTIGDNDRKIVSSDIERASDLMTTTSVFVILLGIAIKLALTGTSI